MYRAIKCGCRYEKCPDWHVSNVADVQGVHFTQEQAEAVSALLNKMEKNSLLLPQNALESEERNKGFLDD